MFLDKISIYILTALSTLLFKPITHLSDWNISERGKKINNGYELVASSTKIVDDCKKHSNQVILFPMIVPGARRLFLDGVQIIEYGDPSFQVYRSALGF